MPDKDGTFSKQYRQHRHFSEIAALDNNSPSALLRERLKRPGIEDCKEIKAQTRYNYKNKMSMQRRK